MHRRVEPRNFHVGTGMLNDPERLEDLEMRKQQSELNARLPPKVKFAAVLSAEKPAGAKPKRARPKTKDKLRPTGPAQQFVGFGSLDDDDDLNVEPKKPGKVVVKV